MSEHQINMTYRDPRPICNCKAYSFPHKCGGGKCTGKVFTEFYLHNIKEHCSQCNCFNDENNTCDVADERESLKHGECYQEALSQHSGEHLQISWEWE